jgi:hypothetical protein
MRSPPYETIQGNKPDTPGATYENYRKAIENKDPEICANAVLCLIHNVT